MNMPSGWWAFVIAPIPFILFAINRGDDVTTPDGKGLNWRWLTTLAISIIAGLLVLVGGLVHNIVSDKNAQLCTIDNSIKTIVSNQAALKETLTKVEVNQNWVMKEMVRVREEIEQDYQRRKK